MDSQFEKHSVLRRENINKGQYTLSLLNEAVASGLLSGAKLEEIQLQIMQVLHVQMERFTKGESTSVSAETAQSLLAGVLYCIDAALLELPSPEDALEFVKNCSIAEIHTKARELVQQVEESTKELLSDLQQNKLSVELEAYQNTVDCALPDFFSSYNADFFPHEATCLIDYPLLFDDSVRTAVFYIRDYIQTLHTETLFCRYFSEQAIFELLTSYGITYHTDFRALLINIDEILLNNCVFSVLSGHDLNTLFLTKPECDALTRKWSDYSAGQIELLIRAATEQIIRQLQIDDPTLVSMLKRYAHQLAPRVLNAVSNNTLHHIAIVQKEAQKPLVQFQDGEKLSDDEIQDLADRILECSRAEGKVLLVHTEIHAMEDLLDILSSECLFGEEYETLFDSFGEAELSLLCLNVIENETNAADGEITPAILSRAQPEKEWQRHFLNYLALLDASRMDAIIRYMKSFSDSIE